ncbi:MAG: GMC family oxidoreductase, partial [Kangiellaceae bacterium]|nr:GMC family oxidoreductase [Kangiellaceae bacterium]
SHFNLLQDFSRLQVNLALLRDGFNADSTGGQVELDEFDYPRLDYSISESLWRGLKHAMMSMVEIQFAAGAKAVMPLHMDAQKMSNWKEAKKQIEDLPTKPIRWQIMSAHVMGGCGIGNQGESVCDEFGRMHQFDNLSVLDGSIFPTSLGVNPQLSIYAIVAKLAASLSVRLGGELPKDLLIEN